MAEIRRALASVGLVVGLVATVLACGGGHAASDAGGDASAAPACDPLAGVGSNECAPGQKCSWDFQTVTAGALANGLLECEADGTVALGGACATTGVDGSGTGPDNCAAGGYCIHGRCEAVCDTAGAVAPCGSGFACSTYVNRFVGLTPAVGVCDATCNGLTQDADAPIAGVVTACGGAVACSGSAAGCGSNGPTLGCYPEILAGLSTCTDTPESRTPPKFAGTDDQQCTVANECAADGGPFLNSCAPGSEPLYRDTVGSTILDCSAFCAPLDTDATTPQNGPGDGSALGKLPTDPLPTVGHARCTIGGLAGKVNEECAYVWPAILSKNRTAGNAFDDTLGVCFRPADALDEESGSATSMPEPACATLRPGTMAEATAGAADVPCSDPTTGTEQDCFAVVHNCYSLTTTYGGGSGAGSAAVRSPLRDLRLPTVRGPATAPFRRPGGIR